MCIELFCATGATIKQQHLRFINMFAATGGSGPGGVSHRFPKGIMEHKVIQNPRAVNADKSLFSTEMEKVVTALNGEYGDEFDKVSGDV